VTSWPSYLPACSMLIVVIVMLFGDAANEQFTREVHFQWRPCE
jgi:hypothetical protein